MGESEEVDLEREKNKSFELGHVSKLEDISEELRERAGEKYAKVDHPRGVEKAKLLKRLGREYEERAEKMRDDWEEKYKSGG